MASLSPEGFVQLMAALPSAIQTDPRKKEKAEVAEEFRTAQAGNFAREQDDMGAAWAPRRGNHSHPPLRDTLAMFQAATKKNASGGIETAGAGFLLMGISGGSVDYAAKHNDGKDGMVKRRFHYLREEDAMKLFPLLRIGLGRILDENVRRFADG
jgi:hypothetical protein